MNEVNIILILYGLFLVIPLVYYVAFVPYALMGDKQSIAKERIGKLVFCITGDQKRTVHGTPINELQWYRDQQAKVAAGDRL
jgi:hypothetical protein